MAAGVDPMCYGDVQAIEGLLATTAKDQVSPI
jgi:hypothetical protein